MVKLLVIGKNPVVRIHFLSQEMAPGHDDKNSLTNKALSVAKTKFQEQ